MKRMSETCVVVGSSVWNSSSSLGIDGGIQLILLVIQSDHGFVNRNVIRALTRFGL